VRLLAGVERASMEETAGCSVTLRFCHQPYSKFIKPKARTVKAAYLSARRRFFPLNPHAFFIKKLALYTTDLDTGRYHRSG
jgi:hypothetical protein